MEMAGLKCSGCGSADVVFEPKMRVQTCNQCGLQQAYSRLQLNANGKVVFSKKNAMQFFKEGKYDMSQKYAYDALNISFDHVPSLYIMAYHDEFVMKRNGALKAFFAQAKPIALEYEELQDIKELFFASAYRLAEFETDVIELIAMNMQTQDDEKELCEFIDTFCPYLISKRTSVDFLSRELIEMYAELAGHCDIPKTCFALLKSIETNPDSPYIGNSFYLHSKSQYFYNNYVEPIGVIIDSMRNAELKNKFKASYLKKKEQYNENLKNA